MVFSRRRHRRRREPAHFTYSRWDGSQTGFDLDADHLFGEMADELLYHGDVNSALRQMMQNGLTDRDGRDMEGIRDMMQRLRERRREILENHNLGGVYDDIADSLREVVETERRRSISWASRARPMALVSMSVSSSSSPTRRR